MSSREWQHRQSKAGLKPAPISRCVAAQSPVLRALGETKEVEDSLALGEGKRGKSPLGRWWERVLKSSPPHPGSYPSPRESEPGGKPWLLAFCTGLCTESMRRERLCSPVTLG